MTNNNCKKYNTHGRTTSYGVLDLRKSLRDNYIIAREIRKRQKGLVDLFAPEFEVGRAILYYLDNLDNLNRNRKR